jgi:hypothetical protein
LFGNRDDGIDVDALDATLTGNTAHDNGDLGIEAVSGVVDGGGNRAWANGDPTQCLNVVCGGSPPSGLTLSPKDATNDVGTQHCVTAGVTDDSGQPAVGETVRFAVTGSVETAGSSTTGPGGETSFCYSGPELPGVDAITAFADSDRDGQNEAGEPADTAAKTWVLPSSTSACAASAAGRITAANGDRATFRGAAHMSAGAKPSGRLYYLDRGPADRITVRSLSVDALVCSDDSATIFGRARVNSSVAEYRIDLSDRSGPDQRDRYRILLGSGYDSGAQQLEVGSVRVHSR